MGKMTKTNQKIPEGWSVKKLGECTLSFSGGTPSVDKTEYYENGKIPFIRSGEIYQDFTELFITKKGLKESSAKMVKKGDLLLALYGANSGDSSVCKIDGAINQAILCIRTKEDNLNFLESLFVIYKDKVIHKYLQGGQGNLSAEIIKSLCFMFPPLCEQEKIAEILGTWDLAIEKLTALIEQKKLLKKGLMQRLLTGKQRLPGFSTPWKKVKLGDVFLKSLHKNKEAKDLPVLTNSAAQGIILQEDYFDREIVTKENLCNYYCTENGDFIYNPRISKNAPAGPIRINHFREKGCISPLYTVFKIKTGNYPFFYEIYFESNLWIYEAYKVANYGARSDRMNITDDDFFNMKIPYPSLPEQKAIANILSKADEEIDLLTAKLSALKSQKKGLMQKLLTGQIRVKVA